MKNKLSLILLIVLALTLTFALVACNPDNPGTGTDDKPNTDFDGAEYTVKFDTTTRLEIPSQTVKHNGKVTAPDTSRLHKTGYTFQYWARAGKEFNFATDTITGNTTLTAVFKADEYTHTHYLHDDLLCGTAHSQITASLPENTAVKSTYDSSEDSFPIPVVTGTEDKPVFMYWYYYTDKDGNPVNIYDEDGNAVYTQEKFDSAMKDGDLAPVMLSKQVAKDDEKATALAKYQYLHGLQVFAMYDVCLPDVTVEYHTDENSSSPFETQSVKPNSTLTAPSAAPAKDGYAFAYWYSVVEKTDEDGNVTVERKEWIFDGENVENPDTIDSGIFVAATVKLYAKWYKSITISNAQDWNDLRDEIGTVSKALNDALADLEDAKEELEANPDSEKLKANLAEKQKDYDDAMAKAEELQYARITFAVEQINLNFGTTELNPAFHSGFAFKGILDGKINDKNCVVTANISPANNYAGIIGVNEGIIRNVDLNITFSVPESAQSTLYAGCAAAVNNGEIANVNVKSVAFNQGITGNIVFGAVAAKMQGGTITDCTVVYGNQSTAMSVTVSANKCAIGGLVGELVSGSLKGCKASGNMSVTVQGGVGYVGGIVGQATGGSISECEFDTVISSDIEKSAAKLYAGGLAGELNGTLVDKCFGNTAITVGSQDKYAQGYAYVGGIAGSHNGKISDSYAIVNINMLVNGGYAYAGGIAGETKSYGGGRGNTEHSYAKGSINAKITSGKLYAGGLFGSVNASATLKNSFSAVAVAITVPENLTDNVNMGYIAGGTAEIDKTVYYLDSVKITRNGEAYAVTGEGDDATANFPVNDGGAATTRENLCDTASNGFLKVTLGFDVKTEKDGKVSGTWTSSDGLNDGFPVLLWAQNEA